MFWNLLPSTPTRFVALLGVFLFFGSISTAWADPGCTNPLACNFDANATEDDGSCDYLSCLVFGCINPSACNFNPDADYNDGSCEYATCAGCMNEEACDYDPEATIAGPCNDFTTCYGCTDPVAPNYDPDATFDDDSCEIPGCTIVGACNFDPNANANDGSCDFYSCLPSGCLNQNACNYDPAAIVSDGSCEFPESGYGCDGACLLDSDGDGVCDPFEVSGCTDEDAINFDEDATENDGSCIDAVPGCQDPTACNFNVLANVDDGSCEFTSCAGCLSPSACNYDATAVYPATCEFPDAGYDCDGNCLSDSDGDGVCDPFEIQGCTNEEACNYDPEATELDGSCDFDSCAGCTNSFACNYDPDATTDDGSCDYFSCIVFGCTTESACNYDPDATYADGSCEFTSCAGCTNPLACDYDPEATISAQCTDFSSCLGCLDPEADNYDPEATQDGGNCIFLGCTIPAACNYDASANSDDGSCEYTSCAGCLNPIACNYDEEAILSGDCTFAENGYDCDGNCLEDTDNDGICDPFEVLGCTNPEAVNFDSDATDDDGSCFVLTEGCIDPSACNYDSEANSDDGSCEFDSCAGCLNETACNYDPAAIYPGTCEFPEYGYNCDGSCIADNDGDGICNPFEIPGCTATDACNYDPEATDDDGSCDFISCNVPGCTNPFACNFDPEAVVNDGSCDFVSCLSFGCTNESACNYDPEANYNDGSCEYTSCAGCTNPLACDYDPEAIIAAGCFDYTSCVGCTDPDAANYDEDATQDNGSCQFPGCTVEGACNYDETANYNDGSCDFYSCLVQGCLNETACNYDPDADLPGTCEYPDAGYDCDGNCLVDTDGDGICDPFEISGCTDSSALNYDEEATEDNGSCILTVEGCTTEGACNFNVLANVDDGSCEYDSCVGCLSEAACNYDPNAVYAGDCEYPEMGYDCDGNCLSDFDGDGVCDPFEVLGCDDPEALNYNPDATQDDGTCIDVVNGCTDADACNFNPDANVDDGSCDFEVCVGCLVEGACNYDPDATIPADCTFPELGYDCDGECLDDSDGDGVCDLFEIAGCTDAEACNYDPEATDDNGSCFDALDGYDCEGNCLSDQDEDGICDPFELPPVLTVPADTLAECGSDLPPATAFGGCSEPVVTFEDQIIPGNCEGNYTVIRTWTASDNCGNSTLRAQTIIFQDTTAPELTVPGDLVVECSDDIPMDEATATDACSSFDIEETSVTTPGDATGNYIIVRTFTVTDDCGNSASATQTITVEDTTAPEFTFVPADYTVECSDEMPMDDAMASDNCGEVTIEVSSETTAGDAAGNYVIVRTFTATDDAGNSSSATQTITVQDTTAPEFTFVPADYTVECSDEMPMDDAVASDNCGEVTIEVSSETTAGDAAGNYVIVRTFTATDDAGNSSSATQTITVQDTTAPEFTFVPADYTVECSDEMPMDDATASDNCGEVTIEVSSETTAGDAAGNYTIVRTFTATDDAGNSASATQTITIQDTTAPEFTFVPTDYTVECSDEMPMDDATASDNCGEVTIEVSSETTAGDAAGNYVIIRTFTATDDAGNSTSATQTITVQDTTAPEFAFVPADYTLECSDEMPMDDATAADNCGEVTIEVSSETTAGDAAGNYVIVRTFTATDDAGNSVSATQTITVQDTTAPEFSFVPADYTVECSDEMPMDDAVASDNCGEVTIEVSSETTAGDAAGNYTIVRTFTATDDAGNSSSATQTITVQDTTAPEFTFVPADYTVECSDEMPMDDATASDNCGEVTIEVSSETTAGDAAGNYVIVRTFTATDDAGNSSSATQTITVQDTTAPEFTFVPADYTVECSDEMPMDDATASDNCGEVTIEVSSETTAGDAAGNYVIVRTFTATDDAGNSTSTTQTITVQDTTAPEFTFVPADYTVECSDEMPMDDATASDNCGEVTIEVSSETTAGDAAGNYVIVRTFTATDDAGNSASASQTITIQDTTAPEFTFVPEGFEVTCSSELPVEYDMATASDNCGEVTVALTFEEIPEDVEGAYTLVLTYTATDDAGNSNTAVVEIEVGDTVPDGDCDCDGNQLDAIGVCGGDCLVDSDGDGICDLFEVFGCTIEEACNYDPEATQNDGSCEFPETGYDCDGNCLEDVNDNGICDIFEVQGCTDPTNPGYNPNATVDNGTCLVGGCLVPFACNYSPEADYQILGFCEFDSCSGCTDAEACNYDEDATQDDGSCDFADEGLDCEGVCLNDEDGDGVCDEDELAGCTDPTNPGYNPNATDDDGSCLVGGCSLPFACNYDPSADYLLLSDCEFTSCAGCTNEDACNYDPNATLDNTSCEFPEDGLDCDGVCLNDADGDGICDEDELAGCTDPTNPGYNPNATDDDGSCLTSGCIIVGACNYDENADYLDPSLCDFTSCQGCTNEEACNYDEDATISQDSSCEYPANGFVDCEGNCLNDMDEDGVCDELEIFGCTDGDAINFNPVATEDNGTCDFAAIGGCTLPFACNFNPDADYYIPGTCDFESCFNLAAMTTCDVPGACNFGEEEPCDFVSCLVLGCTTLGACNYDPEATINDGSCDYFTCIGCTNPNACDFDPEAIIPGMCNDYTSCVGCLDEEADNYDPEATQEGECFFNGCNIPGACNYDAEANNNDGSCDFFSCIGCMNEEACNFDADAIYPGSCSFPTPGLDCEGNCLDDDDDDVCDLEEIEGCTEDNAYNYDPQATEDDGSCIEAIFGCLEFGACNYDMGANTEDGSCEYDSCTGCLSAAACNYNPGATYPGACEFPTPGLDCAGNCLNDEDGDGVCDADEVEGCTDSSAPNFDEDATDNDGSCEAYVLGCTDQEACNYEGDATVDDGSCEFESCAGCLSITACNYDPNAVYPGECEFAEEGYDCDGICISDACGGCMVEQACNYNPEATFDDGSCEFISCLEFGCTDENACNYDPDAQFEDGSCEYPSFPYGCDGACVNDDDGDGICNEFEVEGCTDPNACNYVEGATDNDGSCTYDCTGCTSPAACNYDPEATIDDGSCDFTSCINLGCTDEGACNYDPEAEINDGSCEYLSCAGCTDSEACNYDNEATIDNGACEFPDEGLDCEGNCLNDADGDGVCDEFELDGCTSNCACNYDVDATDDDGSCVFEGCDGCIYETAVNFDANAVFDDGSCIFQGCMDDEFSNYNPVANFEGAGDCTNEPVNADFNFDGEVQLADLLAFLLAYNTQGPDWGMQPWIAEACNVAPFSEAELLATLTFCEGEACCGNEGCSYPSALNYDPNADLDSGFCLFPGCTDPEAFTYDPLATVENGTCSYLPCPDFNGDGVVQVVDLMDFLLAWGVIYD